MKDIIEIKRLWQLGLHNRKIARATGVHRNTVNKYVESFLSDAKLESIKAKPPSAPDWCASVDWEKVRSEYLSGVSLNVIHEELLASNHVQVQYAGFWKQLRKRLDLSQATMVRVFKPGERTEIDYADGICLLYTSPSPRDGLLSRMPSSA